MTGKISTEIKNYYSEELLKASNNCLWKEHYQQNNLQDAVDLIEIELPKTNSGDISEQFEKRLWWTICHLELNQLPLVALCSPLLEIKENNSNNNTNLIIITLVLATEKLSVRNQLRLALSTIEKAFSFGNSSAEFDHKNLELINDFFVSLLEEEIEKNKARREAKDYLVKLEQKLKVQKNIVIKKVKEEATKDIVIEKLIDHIEIHHTSAPLIKLEKQPNNILQKLFATASLIALIYLAWPKIQKLINKEDFKDSPFLSAVSFQFPTNTQAEIPDIRFASLEKNSGNSSLDKVNERLKSLNQTAENAKKDLDQLSSSPEVDQAALTSKESLALKKSTSDQEVVPLTSPEPTQVPTPTAKTPPLEPNKMANLKVEDLDQQPATTSPDLRVGKSGRVYGAPRTIDPTLDPSGHPGKAVDLNGEPLKSYEVNQFSNSTLYKTIAPTNVLSAPSVVASTISHLETDTSIHVISEMGRWLELESRNGKRGYIYAQDAVRAE